MTILDVKINYTYLGYHDHISPSVIYASTIECPLVDCDALVGDMFGEFSSHPRAGLDCLQLSDIGGPAGMGEESLCEDTRTGTNSSLRIRICQDKV